jgi:hypothetical protein
MVMAQVGAALAGFRVAIGMVAFGLRTLTSPLRAAASSADAARRMYAKQLQSGLGAGFTVKRSLIADALGVGEDDVLRYGAAVGILNKKMEWAASTFAHTTPLLTTTGWKFKEMGANLAAASSQFVTAFKDVTDSLADWVSAKAKDWGDVFKGVEERRAMRKWTENKGVEMGPWSKEHGHFFSRVGADGKYDKDFDEKMKKLFNKDRGQDGKAPTPTSFSSRMQGSAWEKMGLVLGAGGSNHAQQTAQNTKRIATLMESLVGTQRGTPAPLNKTLTSKP